MGEICFGLESARHNTWITGGLIISRHLREYVGLVLKRHVDEPVLNICLT